MCLIFPNNIQNLKKHPINGLAIFTHNIHRIKLYLLNYVYITLLVFLDYKVFVFQTVLTVAKISNITTENFLLSYC